ncbi:MAG: ribose ABC transporter permease [Candidatus Aminicenantes bacterium]|nr:ribose ABC transporter permease [Candidatus Aminicenantes bacterium]MDH5466467.1 ribose ABC transporter permease [Candidatus Aminicenantes bacterium]MDH5705443.1 ribose ABC transporter permease [Candidatus Aminicenantes bacterium]
MGKKAGIHSLLKRIWEKYNILLGLLVLFIFSSLVSEAFLTARNLLNVMRQVSINGIIAIGMTFVILTAGIDLSVGAMLAMVGCLCAGLIKFNGLGFILVLLTGLGAGLLMGAANGIVITKGKIQPFIVTLATMTSIRGLAFLYSKGRPIVLGDSTPSTLQFIGEGYIGPIPVPVVLFLAVLALSSFILRRMVLGRYVYAIGGNEEAARLSGINVDFYKTVVYALSGLFVALASLIAIGRLGVGNADLGLGYELNAIAAVVIGGTSLMGGIGTVEGTFIGAVILGILNNILNLLGVGSFFQQILKGIIIIIAVLLSKKRT